jgi:hypothetical protein
MPITSKLRASRMGIYSGGSIMLKIRLGTPVMALVIKRDTIRIQSGYFKMSGFSAILLFSLP